MFWFNESHKITTKKNGPLSLNRVFGIWEIISPDLTNQSSEYIERMWRRVLKQAYRNGEKPNSCLTLGVCLGDILTLIGDRFPESHVVGVDWDGELLTLGRKLNGNNYPKDTTLIEGEAGTITESLQETFDLIVIDLFVGQSVAPVVSEKKFQENIVRLLKPNGILAINVYDQPQHLTEWPKVANEFERVQFGHNLIALYHQKA